MKNDNFNSQQKISSQIAFIIVLLFGLVISWITINVGEKIIYGFSNNEKINIQKNNELLQEKPPLQNKSLKK